jgi:hypothetical protein
MPTLAERWLALEQKIAARGIDWAVSRAPADLRVARRARHPHGSRWEHLVPADYREFIAAVGYPILGFRYYCGDGLSFLPPEHIARISADVGDLDGETPVAVEGAPTECKVAFFAGTELSDFVGWAFGPDDDGASTVWSVEGGVIEPIGTFTEWLQGEIVRLNAYVDGLTDERIAVMRDEGDADPHRVFNYALGAGGDRELHWVEHQEGTPYSHGVIDDGGRWVLPMSKKFSTVAPFIDGIAKVEMYRGPWRTLRRDGTLGE